MPVHYPSVFCGNCGLVLEENTSCPVEETNPCPSCGSVRRNIYVTIHDTGTSREKLGMKGRHSAGGKPFIEQVSGDDLHRKSGKWMNLRRIIDHKNDLYHEVFTDPETGRVVHECKEPLSKHLGHGADKDK